jgi:predicted site-specific integrase-resolvase
MDITVINNTTFTDTHIVEQVKRIVVERKDRFGDVKSEIVVQATENIERVLATLTAYSHVTKRDEVILITFNPQNAWVFSIRPHDG